MFSQEKLAAAYKKWKYKPFIVNFSKKVLLYWNFAKDKPLEFISTFLQRFVILPKKGAAKEIIINAASYFQILYTLLREALQMGELRESKAAYNQARVIGEIHRGLTYSWLLSECRYSLTDIVKILLKTYIDSIRA